MNKSTDKIWNAIIEKIRILSAQGDTYQEIGDRLGVARATISRWLRGERGGVKTPMADVMHYINALSIPPSVLCENFTPIPLASADVQLAKMIRGIAVAQEFSFAELAREVSLSEADLRATLDGLKIMSFETFYLLCKTLNQDIEALLSRSIRISLQKENSFKKSA